MFGRNGLLRSICAAVVLGLVCLLVPLSVTGWWLRGTVTDTDTYVDTVAPLATDPEVKTAVERVLVRETMSVIDRQDLPALAAEALVDAGVGERGIGALGLLMGGLRERLEELVADLANRLVTSPQFAPAWEESNRALHKELIDVLEGDASLELGEDGRTISLQLATIGTALREGLVEAGVPGADRLPTINASLPIADAQQLEKAQRGYQLLDRVGLWLPVLTVVLLAVGLALARSRSRALARTALGSLTLLVLLLLGIVFAREYVAGGVPAESRAAASAVITILTDPLRLLVRASALVALVIAAAAWLVGSGSRAVAARRATTGAAAWTFTPVVAGTLAGAAVLALLIGDFGRGGTATLVATALLGGLVALGTARAQEKPS